MDIPYTARRLAIAATHLASRLMPRGFDVGQDAPDTLERINAHVRETGRFLVSSEASERTVYGDAEANYAFRAWHDWTHWRFQFPFTLEGETETAYTQAGHLIAIYGGSLDTRDMVALLLCEVIGQARHLAETGDFPSDQVAFTSAHAHEYLELADKLVWSAPGRKVDG